MKITAAPMTPSVQKISSDSGSPPNQDQSLEDTFASGERFDIDSAIAQQTNLKQLLGSRQQVGVDPPSNVVSDSDGRLVEAYIIDRNGNMQSFDGTRNGWNGFVDAMNKAAADATEGTHSPIRKAFVMGHAGPDGIYPERFPNDDLTHSYLWVNDQKQVMVGSHGGQAPLKSLGWDRLNLEEFQVMGCGSATTYDGKNITESMAKTLKTRAVGNREIYWFHTECMKKSPFLEPLNAPRVFDYRQPSPSAGPSPKP